MEFAIVNGFKEKASPKAQGICQICHQPMISKCGRKVKWHWAHITQHNCDVWWENEGEWHRSWKEFWDEERREVVHICQESSERHIADIKNSRSLVIELQNSSISHEEANSREKFYKNMVWVVNAKKFWKNISLGCRIPSPESYVYEQYNVVPAGEKCESFLIQISGTKVSRDELVETWGSQKVDGWEDYENGQFTYAFKWSNARSIWLTRSCKQFWDIGEDILFEVVKCGNNGLLGLSAISKKRFIKENDGNV